MEDYGQFLPNFFADDLAVVVGDRIEMKSFKYLGYTILSRLCRRQMLDVSMKKVREQTRIVFNSKFDDAWSVLQYMVYSRTIAFESVAH